MHKPKVLIVDDEKDIQESLCNFVSRNINCEIQIAGNGNEALEKLKKSKFDLVLLDIKMPGLSGIDVIKETMKFAPETKILVISGYDSEEIAAEALKAGAVDYITKPHSIEAIELKVKNILIKAKKYYPKKS